MTHYDVMMVENKTKLIYLIKENTSSFQFYIADSELLDLLHKTHLAIGHGRMLKELSPKYKNITLHEVELYLYLCEPCQNNKKVLKMVL